MKIFIKNLLFITYITASIGILITAMVYPLALLRDDAPPLWTCWVLYPIALIIMASQHQVLNTKKQNK